MKKVLVILLAVGLLMGLTGCPDPAGGAMEEISIFRSAFNYVFPNGGQTVTGEGERPEDDKNNNWHMNSMFQAEYEDYEYSYEYQVEVEYEYDVEVEYEYQVEVEYEYQVEVEYEYQVEVEYEYQVEVEYEYQVEVEYEYQVEVEYEYDYHEDVWVPGEPIYSYGSSDSVTAYGPNLRIDNGSNSWFEYNEFYGENFTADLIGGNPKNGPNVVGYATFSYNNGVVTVTVNHDENNYVISDTYKFWAGNKDIKPPKNPGHFDKDSNRIAGASGSSNTWSFNWEPEYPGDYINIALHTEVKKYSITGYTEGKWVCTEACGTRIGTRWETRTGTRWETRTGTRWETRTGTRWETRTGTRWETRIGTRMETRTGTKMETRIGTRMETRTGTETERRLVEVYQVRLIAGQHFYVGELKFEFVEEGLKVIFYIPENTSSFSGFTIKSAASNIYMGPGNNKIDGVTIHEVIESKKGEPYFYPYAIIPYFPEEYAADEDNPNAELWIFAHCNYK